MNTSKNFRRYGFILILAALAAAPLSVRAGDPVTTVLAWLGLGAPPPAPTAGPGSCPTGGGC